MTQPPTDPEDAVPEDTTPEEPDADAPGEAAPEEPPALQAEADASVDEPPASPAAPAWSWVLTPLAVLLGAAAIVVTIIVTDDDPQPVPAQEPIAPALAELAEAVDTLTAAAGLLASAAQRAEAPSAPVTLVDALTGYAASLDLDTASFTECLASASTGDIVNEHLQRGIDLGVTGTPTFFVNNKLISGAQPPAVFLEVISAELEGSPTSLADYSPTIQGLAATDPPRFAILPQRPDFSGASIEGDPGARVVVIEYSDFQCPFCRRWYNDTLPSIRDFVGEDVAIAFLHFPLVQIHPNAAGAHFAAECAGAQGKFFEMHDLLFERQDEWSALPNVN